MRILAFILSVLTLMNLSGCSKKLTSSVQANPQTELRLHGQLFWVEPSGIYKGAVPCSNCAGIEVTLDFSSDNTVKKTMRFIREDRKKQQFTGTWVVQAGNIIQISYPKSLPTEFYKAKSGGHLVALNAQKEEEKIAGGQFNIFNKDSMTKKFTVQND